MIMIYWELKTEISDTVYILVFWQTTIKFEAYSKSVADLECPPCYSSSIFVSVSLVRRIKSSLSKRGLI